MNTTTKTAPAAAPPLKPLHPTKLYHVRNTHEAAGEVNNGVRFARGSDGAMRTVEPVPMGMAANFHGVPGFDVVEAGDAPGFERAATDAGGLDVDKLIADARLPLEAEIARLRAAPPPPGGITAEALQAKVDEAVEEARAAFRKEQGERESILVDAALTGIRLDRRKTSNEKLHADWDRQKAAAGGSSPPAGGAPPPSVFDDE